MLMAKPKRVKMEDKFIVLQHSMIRRTDLTMQEKIVYLEILSLSSLEKGCIASNNHFELSFGISKKSVSNTISSLIKKGFIVSELTNRNHKRVLSIKSGGVSTKDGQVSIKSGETKETITSNKTINNNSLFSKYVESKETTKNEEALILDYLVYRKQLKKQIKTLAPLKAYYKIILDLHTKGYHVKACIELMKEKEWMTLSEEWIKNSGLNNKPDFTEVVL